MIFRYKSHRTEFVSLSSLTLRLIPYKLYDISYIVGLYFDAYLKCHLPIKGVGVRGFPGPSPSAFSERKNPKHRNINLLMQCCVLDFPEIALADGPAFWFFFRIHR